MFDAGRFAAKKRTPCSNGHNAAQAEYDRLAALVSPKGPEIPPAELCRRMCALGFTATSKFS